MVSMKYITIRMRFYKTLSHEMSSSLIGFINQRVEMEVQSKIMSFSPLGQENGIAQWQNITSGSPVIASPDILLEKWTKV